MNLKPFLLVSLVFSCLLTYSQDDKKTDIIDRQLSKCLDKTENQTTAGMCDCTYKALEKWDKKLNDTYKTLFNKLDAVAKKKLAEAQREWIKFKEKEIELIDETYGKADGTMWRIVRADKVLEITRRRALDLETLLKTFNEF